VVKARLSLISVKAGISKKKSKYVKLGMKWLLHRGTGEKLRELVRRLKIYHNMHALDIGQSWSVKQWGNRPPRMAPAV